MSETTPTPRTHALLAQWDDDGASRGAAYLELRDLALELERELAAARAEVEGLRAQYNDLIMCVGNKYPGESRHDTAKRYLIRAGTPVIGPASAALAKEKAS